MTRDAQFTVTPTATAPSCPKASPGYVADGTITVVVTDGSTCAGTYTVTVTPVPNSNPAPIGFAPATPPAVVVGPVVGPVAGVTTFNFSGAGVGSYMISVMETSGCNPVNNPVTITAFPVPNGVDTQVPFVRVTDLLGNIVVTNDPLFPPVTLNATLPTINVPEGECGSQERFFAYGYDTCDGVLTTPPSISATAVTVTPTTIDPETQVTVDSDGFGIWDVEVHWSIGTSVVTVTARDASNNAVNLTIQRTVIDNIDPIVTIVGSSQVTIPVCETTAVVPYTVQVDDLCDQEAVNFANLTLTLFSGNPAGVTIGPALKRGKFTRE